MTRYQMQFLETEANFTAPSNDPRNNGGNSMEQIKIANHCEAVEQMATERYLLNELSPELRDAYEEHLFDCPECANDLRAAEAFVTEAKIQLPELTTSSVAPVRSETPRQADAKPARKSFLDLLRPFFANPAFAAPAFATLLLVLGYQNFVTYPALVASANDPRIVPWVTLHVATRAGEHIPVTANRERGIMLLLDVAEHADVEGTPDIASYDLVLADSTGKTIWTRTLTNAQASISDGTLSLLIPGAELRQGAYTLSVSAIASSGQRGKTHNLILDVQLSNN